MKLHRPSTIRLKLILLIFLSVTTSRSQELEILGYWDFNDPSDPAASSDVTGSSPDLEFIGGAAYTDDGDGLSDSVGDYALDLGGVNDGSLAQTIEGDHLNTAYDNNAMSVAFWQNITQTGNTSSFWIHSPNATQNQRGFQSHTPWGNGTIYFDQSGCCDPPQRLTVGGGLVQLNQWQHFVFQRDADGNMEIWVDGVQAASQGGARPLEEFNGIISVGAEGPSQANSMAGRIDDFAIFNNVLDEDQIASLAGGSSPLELIDTSDDDEDGLPDLWEEKLVDNLEDLNGNASGPGPGSGTGDFDGDGLTDLDEYEETKTDPTKADTDDDGLSDGVETNTGTYVSATNTGTNPKKADTDRDGLADGVETNTGKLVDAENTGTDPNNSDTDGDGYADLFDAFPNDNTQWDDWDGDGYGENFSGNMPDSCPNQAGTSTLRVFGNANQSWQGCSDSASDSYEDNSDQCPFQFGNSWVDRFACLDTDLDGISDLNDPYPNTPTSNISDWDDDSYPDNSDNPSLNNDSFPFDNTQWFDSDGDGFGDNTAGNNPDAFPNDPFEWEDSDSDGYGDNSVGPQPDACPSDEGYSMYDRYGCDDYDQDGWSDVNDDCVSDDGFSWWGQFGCDDDDQDGWVDDGILGDRYPTNWKQALDTDRDSYGDNHGPDCCNVTVLGVTEVNVPDLFPYNRMQWEDNDNDGYGDNESDVEFGDKCWWIEGYSWRDDQVVQILMVMAHQILLTLEHLESGISKICLLYTSPSPRDS